MSKRRRLWKRGMFLRRKRGVCLAHTRKLAQNLYADLRAACYRGLHTPFVKLKSGKGENMKLRRLVFIASAAMAISFIFSTAGFCCGPGECCCSAFGSAGGYLCRVTEVCDAGGGTCYNDSYCSGRRRKTHSHTANMTPIPGQGLTKHKN